MFEDEHLLEGGRCGSASHCETLSIAVASLSHQIILSQPPIAFTCSISLFAVFPLRTSPSCMVMISTLPCPGHSTRIQADPGGSEWNGRNLVGIQVNSNLIPSKNNLIIQTQIFIHSRSFQVIPGHSRWNPSKKKDDYFSHILGSFPPYSRSFQVHSSHIPGSFPPHSRFIPTISQVIPGPFQVHSPHIPGHSGSTPGPFQPHSGYIPAIFLVNSRSISGGIGLSVCHCSSYVISML